MIHRLISGKLRGKKGQKKIHFKHCHGRLIGIATLFYLVVLAEVNLRKFERKQTRLV